MIITGEEQSLPGSLLAAPDALNHRRWLERLNHCQMIVDGIRDWETMSVA